MASSGWSHAFLTEKNHFLYPDTPADRTLFDALRMGNYDAWRNYPAASVEASGQQEILNWMCLAGVLAELESEAGPRRSSSIPGFLIPRMLSDGTAGALTGANRLSRR